VFTAHISIPWSKSSLSFRYVDSYSFGFNVKTTGLGPIWILDEWFMLSAILKLLKSAFTVWGTSFIAVVILFFGRNVEIVMDDKKYLTHAR